MAHTGHKLRGPAAIPGADRCVPARIPRGCAIASRHTLRQHQRRPRWLHSHQRCLSSTLHATCPAQHQQTTPLPAYRHARPSARPLGPRLPAQRRQGRGRRRRGALAAELARQERDGDEWRRQRGSRAQDLRALRQVRAPLSRCVAARAACGIHLLVVCVAEAEPAASAALLCIVACKSASCPHAQPCLNIRACAPAERA
jgi:hypothetical protein